VHVVGAQLVEALRYYPEGRGFHSRWCHLEFFIDIILPAIHESGVESGSSRHEYQENLLGVKPAGA
jgi:hypothetical protein